MKKTIVFIISGLLVLVVYAIIINYYVINTTENKILKDDKIKEMKVDAIIVLGASVQGDTASPMLEDRLEKSVEVYNEGVTNTVIMSGDNATKYYDEVSVMSSYAISNGIPKEIIIEDYAGLSTYDSIYRAKELFDLESVIIITQEYHLYRAIFIANALGLDAYGVAAKEKEYNGDTTREVREFAARNKDFLLSVFQPVPENIDDKSLINKES